MNPSDPEYPFECAYCHKRFKRERAYLDHRCKHMIKQEELRSPIGQAALVYYKAWFQAKGKSVMSDSTFASSKMYHAFIRFAQFAIDVSLPMPLRYVNIMVARQIEPREWTGNDAYVIYLEYLDNAASPLELVSMTVKTILALAQRLDIDTAEVFSVLTVQEIITLIQKRKLSPWVLLLSNTFLAAMQRSSPEQRTLTKSLVPLQSWHQRLRAHPDVVGAVKQYVQALGI